jgi:F0F1-type ATP synthase membrane subunit c/vacuolar-type H+-ATPase subunit K
MDAEAAKLLAAALSIGLGAIGPGIGIGIIASRSKCNPQTKCKD